jgi:aerobic C4-dicarboxylate transport protein
VGALDRKQMHRVLDGESSPEELRALYEEEDDLDTSAPGMVPMHNASA